MAARAVCHLLGRASGNDAAAAVAAFRPEVDHPVGGLDDIQIVLDDDHRVSRVAQAVEDVQQQADVVEMQAGGGLIQYV